MEKIRDFFESKIMIIISTILFFISLVFLIIKSIYALDINPYLDPIVFVIIISGYPIFFEAFDSLINEKKITSELLVSIAIVASLIISEVFAAGEVAFIMTIGEVLENKTIEKAKKGLNDLIKLSENKAHVLVENKLVDKDSKDIKIGDIIKVFPGEEIPIDGIVIEGNSYVNQMILTGESIPKLLKENDVCFQGTYNTDNYLIIKSTKEYNDTSLNKMIELMKNAENKEAPIKRIADKWASILVPVSCLIALLVGIINYIVIGNSNNEALIRAVTVLVVFCPCALSLSTPTAVMASIGQASKNNVLIKSGESLESLGKTNVIFFDKTGTLTYGMLEVTDIKAYKDIDILSIAASLEQNSEHPIAKAITNSSTNIKEVKNFKYSIGKGISGTIENINYYLGNDGVENEEIINLKKQGKMVIYLKDDNDLIGYIALRDKLREDSKTLIKSLKNANIKTVLLTGDNSVTANAVAKELSIDEVCSSLLPIDKVKIIEDYNGKGFNTLMIGDGINDAPSMKTATNGVSLSNIGSDITKEASSITLMNDDIMKLIYSINLSKACINTIKFNITLSLIINMVAIILSAIGILNPILGAIVHNVGSVLVVLNAALLLNKKINKSRV